MKIKHRGEKNRPDAIILRQFKGFYRLIFSFIVVATAILVSCNEEFEELTSDYTPHDRDGIYSGDNLTFTVDGEPRTVNSVTISSRQVGNDTLYSDNLKKHYLNPIYATNIIIKGFPGKKDRITIPAISSVDKFRGCIEIYPEYYDCLGKFTGSPLDRHEFQGLAYIIHSGFISGYQNRYGDNLKPPTNVYHRMTA